MRNTSRCDLTVDWGNAIEQITHDMYHSRELGNETEPKPRIGSTFGRTSLHSYNKPLLKRLQKRRAILRRFQEAENEELQEFNEASTMVPSHNSVHTQLHASHFNKDKAPFCRFEKSVSTQMKNLPQRNISVFAPYLKRNINTVPETTSFLPKLSQAPVTILETIDLTGEDYRSEDDNSIDITCKSGKSGVIRLKAVIEEEEGSRASSCAHLGIERNSTELWERKIEVAFRLQDDNIVASFTESNHRVCIRAESFKRLQGDRWLDDEIINCFGGLLNIRNDRVFSSTNLSRYHVIPRTYMFSSFFFTKLCQGKRGFNYLGVKRWTERARIDVWFYDLLLFPVLVCRNHWALCVADIQEKEFIYLDSLYDHDGFDVVSRIKKWLYTEVKTRKGKEMEKDWDVRNWTHRMNTCKIRGEGKHRSHIKAPIQTDGSSCGIFMLQNADCLAMGRPPLFHQRDVRSLRKKLAVDIIRSRLSISTDQFDERFKVDAF